MIETRIFEIDIDDRIMRCGIVSDTNSQVNLICIERFLLPQLIL